MFTRPCVQTLELQKANKQKMKGFVWISWCLTYEKIKDFGTAVPSKSPPRQRNQSFHVLVPMAEISCSYVVMIDNWVEEEGHSGVWEVYPF